MGFGDSVLKLILWIPYPPSMNTYWRNFRGRTVLSAAGREFKKHLSAAVTEKFLEEGIEGFNDRPVAVTIILHPRDRRRTDIDNRVKPVLDALEDAGVFDNDSQVELLLVKRDEMRKGGACWVLIEDYVPPLVTG